MSDEIESLKAAGMYREDGGPTYLERHGHVPDEPCGKFCPGNPWPLGGNSGWSSPQPGPSTNPRHQEAS
jgi:hypothetical protein